MNSWYTLITLLKVPTHRDLSTSGSGIIDGMIRLPTISFPEAAILLVSDRDRDLWDNPFADNKILVVVPTEQARTNKRGG